MAFPSYVPTRTISLSANYLDPGVNAAVTLTVTLRSSKDLTWTATGYKFAVLLTTLTSAPPDMWQATVPTTDATGWQDTATGLALSSPTHNYTATIEFVSPAGGQTVPAVTIGPFDLPLGDGSVVSLDSLFPQTTVTGTIPDIWGSISQKRAEVASITDASQLTTGTLNDARLPTASQGASVTNASNLTTGTVADARLPTTAQAATLAKSYLPGAMPELYGAVGDGVTDDTAAVQAALNAAAGKGFVVLANTYKITTTLAAPAYSAIRGKGTLSATGINVLQLGAHSLVDGVTITDSAAGGGGVGAAVYVTGSDCVLSHLTITGFRWGVNISDATRVEVGHCEVTAQTGAATPVGIYATGSTTYPKDISVHDNYVHDVSGAGIMVNFEPFAVDINDANCQVMNNRVVTVSDNGIRVQTKNGQVQRGWRIAGNTVISAAVNAIRINGTGLVQGNTIIGSNAGIRDGGGVGGTWATDCVIAGNQVYGSSYAGAGIQLQLGGTENVVTDNEVTGWNYGIYLGESGTSTGSCAHDTVSSNIVHDNGRDGIIALTGVADVSIHGNRAWDNGHLSSGKAGITLSGCSRVHVVDNACYGVTGSVQTYGFSADAGCDSIVVTGNNWSRNVSAAQYLGTNFAVKGNIEQGSTLFDKDAAAFTVSTYTNTWAAVSGYPFVLNALNGYVAVSGILTVTTLANVGLTITTLPANLRPSRTQFLTIPSNKGHLWVMTVGTDGSCVLSTTYGVGVSATATTDENFQLAGQYAL